MKTNRKKRKVIDRRVRRASKRNRERERGIKAVKLIGREKER